MYSLWKGINDTDLLGRVADCSLYDLEKYREIIGSSASQPLQRFPFLARSDLASWLERQVFDENEIFWWKTSGTSTGKRLKIAFPRDFHKDQLDKVYNTYFPVHYAPGKMHAHLCPPAISGLFVDTAATRVERTKDEEIFMSPSRLPALWEEQDYERIHADMRATQPSTIRFDPYFLCYYLDWVFSTGKELTNIPLLLSSYSHLTVQLRKKIEGAYGVPVVDLFGMSECGPIYFDNGTRCDIWSQGLHYEIEDRYIESDDVVIAEGFLSSLRNPVYPLVRYRTGDLIRLRKKGSTIVSARLCGRDSNVIFLPNDHKEVGTLDRVITQDTLSEAFDKVEIGMDFQLLVKAGSIEVFVRKTKKNHRETMSIHERMRGALDSLLGDYVEYKITAVDHLLAEVSGKISIIKKV